MLIHVNVIHDYILSWTRTLAETNKHKSMLCVITGGIDSCLNAALLLKATSYIPVNIIFMGFKPENENIFEQWVIANFGSEHYNIIKPNHPTFDDPVLANIDARSSLISSYVDMYCKAYESLNFGTITKSEYSLVKFYKSRIDEVFDYYPIIDLYRSECIQLANYIKLPQQIIDDKSIKMEDFQFSHDDLEWLDRENNNLSIVEASNPPHLAGHYALFDQKNKLLLLKVHQLNKDNKNKIIPDNKKCSVRIALPGCIS